MTLRDYLHKNYITQKSFAALLDISEDYMGSIVNGRLKASKKLARNIEKLTSGEIKAEEVREDLAEKKSA